MPNCHEMKKGEIYYCDYCGMELKVIVECKDVAEFDQCYCKTDPKQCHFICCGNALAKKE